MSSEDISIPPGPERQRILNVLAQRRYRQRKRERERLEALGKERLDPGPDGTNAMYTPGGETQLQHPIQHPFSSSSQHPFASSSQHPFPSSSSPGMANNSSYGQYQETVIGASPYVYFTPSESTCSMPESSPSYVGNQFESNSLLPYGSAPQSVISTSDSQFQAELQDLETAQFTFPCERAIDIPLLKSMEVTLRIAQMLGLADELLDLTISRVLDVSRISVPMESVPENLRPTEAQLLLPHCPIIDVLPWPSVRTKLICFFNQPDHLRPPIARGDMGIMRLMIDLGDESEGLHIALDVDGYGYDGKTWEVGQAVLKHWWWALDPEIISNSNRLRSMRGAPRLQLLAS